MTAGIAGFLSTLRFAAGSASIGDGLLLFSIAGVIVGGVSLFGGVGNIPGVVIGGLFVGVLGNGMNLMRIESYQQDMIKGIVLVSAVMLDMYTKRFENRT